MLSECEEESWRDLCLFDFMWPIFAQAQAHFLFSSIIFESERERGAARVVGGAPHRCVGVSLGGSVVRLMLHIRQTKT